MSELHELMQDDGGHWYVIPVVYKDTFNEMMRRGWTEITDDGYKLLEEWRVDGPHSVQFMWPRKQPDTED